MSDSMLGGTVETAVIGAGQAGLVMSWFLGRAGREHVVLERGEQLGGSWRHRWDNFCVVTPNWSTALPGYPYDGDDPDGFMPRDQIVERVARYADVIRAPVERRAGVRRLARLPDGAFALETERGTLRAERVVVATGGYHVPRIPAAAAGLSERITQLHSHAYRNEAELPPGAVLIVGSGQSGVQIAEELADAGRRVFLSLGTAGRMRRRYRGHDIIWWFREVAVRGREVGLALPTVDTLPDPRLRLAGNPQLTGHGGGHEVDLRQMAQDGRATLLGRFDGASGERVAFAPDMAANLARSERFFDERMRPIFDTLIERTAMDAPPDDARFCDFEPEALAGLDLAEAGVSTIIWTSGYRLDFSWLDLPILDDYGYPRHVRGVSEAEGLYFLGLPWLYQQGSAALFGVAADAQHVARQMGVLAEPLPV